MVGIDTLDKYAHLFGFGEKSGIDLKGEIPGLIPSPAWQLAVKDQPWYPGQTLNTAIGQGDLLVTPLQIALATSVIANGGKLLLPSLLPSDKPQVVREGFLKKETLATIRAGMAANQKGDGNAGFVFNDFPISSAGKTGSAEAGGDTQPHAWFTAFAPLQKPQIEVTVMIEQAGNGSEVAAPVVKQIFTWWFKNRK